jgi:hypothetical protein
LVTDGKARGLRQPEAVQDRQTDGLRQVLPGPGKALGRKGGDDPRRLRPFGLDLGPRGRLVIAEQRQPRRVDPVRDLDAELAERHGI